MGVSVVSILVASRAKYVLSFTCVSLIYLINHPLPHFETQNSALDARLDQSVLSVRSEGYNLYRTTTVMRAVDRENHGGTGEATALQKLCMSLSSAKGDGGALKVLVSVADSLKRGTGTQP